MARKTDKNYIAHGSEEHANLLGIRKADDSDEIVWQGYALMDETAFGVNATERYLRTILKQKYNTLKTPPAVPQSDPLKPNFAQPMFDPK